MGEALAGSVRTPLREGLFSGSLDDLDAVCLTGSRCSECGEVSLGQESLCPNCGGASVETIPLAKQGVLWSFTVIRHRPPGGYGGDDPFEPFGLGLIELPEGLRVLSPIDCDIAALKVGMRLNFTAYVRPTPEGERVLFTFAPA
jgi:uncharacterized OB-fold protein